ncbi:hypothetical protein [Paractinoplanes atraurantiacus]|uniref:Uncharacterized protein n=1 Tax=Paractinoplanes atraurantiacus TaxID=1036182 RepID=A0A285JFZ5_9ACTN|nr:hypothetical protein [Actinoplanes atraurantiacus]SNY59220.1 hypothetical protein SAMN05421748_12085 [Actinoplanes atraurantiacus]
MTQRPDREWFLLRWLAVVTAGEFAGFCVPVIAGALTAGVPAAIALPAVLAAGAVEGTMLGLAQATVLRRVLVGFPVRRWLAATAGAAVLAYAIGMMPSTWPAAAPVVLIIGGPVLLASIGTAQWLVLRTVLRRSASWIAGTAFAWLVGLGVFLGLATPLWRPGQALPTVLMIGAVAGLLMAAVTSGITGLVMGRLVRHSRLFAATRKTG